MKTLGKTSANLITQLFEENKTFFTIGDIIRINNTNFNAAKKLISDLAKRKIIARLKGGKYLIIPQELGNIDKYIGNWYIATREVINSPDYYIAFYSAMHHWGMLTQPITKVLVATPKRQFVSKEMKDKLIIIFVNKKFVWGIKEDWVTKTEKIRFSDLEKTIIDCLAYPKHCGGITEIAKGIWISKDKIDYIKLCDYADKYDKNVVAKRLGYVLEILKINQPVVKERFKKYIKDRYDLFDPTLPKQILNKNNWRLIDNVGEKTILNLIKY